MSLLPDVQPAEGRDDLTAECLIVYAVVDLRSSLDHPLGDAVETFIRREDA